MPAWLIPAIQAAASLGGNLFNISQTKKTNQQQTDVNAQLYEKQRADALTDWNRQNAYNSPSQQMQRFKEAGLNPNLIYGQMTNAPVVRSTEAKAPDYVAPRLDTSQVGNILGSYYDIKSKELMLKQQQRAIDMADEDIINKKLKNNYDSSFTYSTEVGGIKKQQLQENVDKTIEDWQMTRSLRSMNPLRAEQIQEQIKSLTNNIRLSNLDYRQREMMNSVIKDSMRQAMRIQGNRYELDKLSNELENTLRRKSIYGGQELDNVIKSAKDLMDMFWQPMTYGNQFLK
jgi:hypothetical protein